MGALKRGLKATLSNMRTILYNCALFCGPSGPPFQRNFRRTNCGKMTTLQRTLWGGGKKRGVENLTNDTPPKKGFWTPPRTVRFPPPSGVSALFFLYKNPRQSRPKALLEGSKNFRESAFSGTFPPPHTFLEGPNLEKFQDHPPGLKFSSEIETDGIFKRD